MMKKPPGNKAQAKKIILLSIDSICFMCTVVNGVRDRGKEDKYMPKSANLYKKKVTCITRVNTCII